VIQELDSRGWTNKRWITRKTVERGGKPFTKNSLHRLLTNVTYLGKLRYKSEVHAGEHDAIVDPSVWERVQSLLRRNGRCGSPENRNRFGALLKGILRCVSCNAAMTPTHATKKGTKRYRYYVCTNAQHRGWQACPTPSIPAAEIERFVIDQIRKIGRSPDIIRETVIQARHQSKGDLTTLETERLGLERDLDRWHTEVRGLAAHVGPSDEKSPALARMVDLQERIQEAERRATSIREQIHTIHARAVSHQEVSEALGRFDPLWNSLSPREQVRVISLLVERIDFDGVRGKVAVTFYPNGIRELHEELARTEDAA
jgi:site-specific DNA recombinase